MERSVQMHTRSPSPVVLIQDTWDGKQTSNWWCGVLYHRISRVLKRKIYNHAADYVCSVPFLQIYSVQTRSVSRKVEQNKEEIRGWRLDPKRLMLSSMKRKQKLFTTNYMGRKQY